MKTLALAIAAVAAAGCSAKGYDSPLDITAVLAGKPTAGSDLCPVEAGTPETSYLKLGPDNVGQIGVVIHNRLADNSSLNTLYRINTNDFDAQSAHVDFEVLGGGNLPSVTRPTGGFVKVGTETPVGVVLFDKNQLAGAGLAEGTFFRATIQIEGHLHDNSLVKTTKRDYLFQYCAAPGCAGNTCL